VAIKSQHFGSLQPHSLHQFLHPNGVVFVSSYSMLLLEAKPIPRQRHNHNECTRKSANIQFDRSCTRFVANR